MKMCIAVPGRIESIGQATPTSIPGRVSIIETERDVDLLMVPDAVIGDYVVVHSGYAIERIPKERALETLVLLGVGTSADHPRDASDKDDLSAL